MLLVVVEEVDGVVVGGGTAKLNEYATGRTAASVVKTTGRLLILMFGLILMNYEYDRVRYIGMYVGCGIRKAFSFLPIFFFERKKKEKVENRRRKSFHVEPSSNF